MSRGEGGQWHTLGSGCLLGWSLRDVASTTKTMDGICCSLQDLLGLALIAHLHCSFLPASNQQGSQAVSLQGNRSAIFFPCEEDSGLLIQRRHASSCAGCHLACLDLAGLGLQLVEARLGSVC